MNSVKSKDEWVNKEVFDAIRKRDELRAHAIIIKMLNSERNLKEQRIPLVRSPITPDSNTFMAKLI